MRDCICAGRVAITSEDIRDVSAPLSIRASCTRVMPSNTSTQVNFPLGILGLVGGEVVVLLVPQRERGGPSNFKSNKSSGCWVLTRILH